MRVSSSLPVTVVRQKKSKFFDGFDDSFLERGFDVPRTEISLPMCTAIRPNHWPKWKYAERNFHMRTVMESPIASVRVLNVRHLKKPRYTYRFLSRIFPFRAHASVE